MARYRILDQQIQEEMLQVLQHRGDWTHLLDLSDEFQMSVGATWDVLNYLWRHKLIEKRYGGMQWKAIFEAD